MLWLLWVFQLVNILSLRQNWNNKIQIILFFCNEQHLSLKYLAFHTVHQMHAGIIFCHFFCLTQPLALSQQLNSPFVVLGIHHLSPIMLRNSCHSCSEAPQCKNRRLVLSVKWLASFLQDYVKRQTRFVSRQPAKVIITTIEAAAESLGLKVHTRNYKVHSKFPYISTTSDSFIQAIESVWSNVVIE